MGKLVVVETVTKGAKDVIHKIESPYIHFTASHTNTPPYTNLISTQRNVLVEDDKHRSFLPYHGDFTQVDFDYAEMEGIIGQNRLSFQRTNMYCEQAKFYGDCAESFLSEMGTNVESVLRYLLDDNDRTRPSELPAELFRDWKDRNGHARNDYYDEGRSFSSEDSHKNGRLRRPYKLWKTVLDSLPTSSGCTLVAAAMSCMAFWEILEFSLLHIVVSHRLYLEVASGKHRSGDPSHGKGTARDATVAKNLLDLSSTYAALGCLVCYSYVLFRYPRGLKLTYVQPRMSWPWRVQGRRRKAKP